MDFVPLHTVPEYFEECAELLNQEWKRSLTARLHSLKKSCDTLPVCLVLLENNKKNGWSVVGHSRLSHILGQSDKSCLVESVVVRKNLRGKGYGRKVMEKTEEYAASKGYKVIYLTTHDKQDFYRHLGYEFCSPIVCFDSNLVPEHLAQKLLGNMNISEIEDSQKPSSQTSVSDDDQTEKRETVQSDIQDNLTSQANSSSQCHTPSLSLNNSAAPPAPPPPFAPPPPPVPSISSGKDSRPAVDGKTVIRWDPKLVSWMKKVLSD